MITPRLFTRALLLLLALALAVAGCGRFARRGAVAPSPTATVEYGSGITVQDPLATAGSKKPTTGTLEVRYVSGKTGKPMAGLYLVFSGAQRKRVRSGPDGIARAILKPGRYTAAVEKCGDTVVIDEPLGYDKIVIGAGQVIRDQQVVDAHDRRYKPTNSVEASRRAPWTRNQRIVLGVKIQDGCDFSAVARNVSVKEFRWRASPTLEVIETPERSDAAGFARVTIACVAGGDADLVMYLPGADPPLEVAVVDAMSRPFSVDWCQ